jgi:hypothetical protein
MERVTLLPAPEIVTGSIEETDWERERRGFQRLLPSLLATYPGQYVAVRDGAVVASGTDRITVALEAYRQVGYVPLYVGLVVEDSPKRTVRLPSPRVLRRVTQA